MKDSDHTKAPATILLDKIGTALATAVAAVIVYILVALGGPIATAIAEASTKEFLVRLAGLLGFSLLLAVAYVFHLRSQVKKPLSSGFDFNEQGGFYIDRKTSHKICTRCLGDGVVLHLKRHAPTLLWCSACHTAYTDNVKKTETAA